jgi:signal transduction histidine kinase
MKHLDLYLQQRGTRPANEALELELTPTQRLEISHHLNNPLSIVFMSLELAKLAHDPAQIREQLERAERNAVRIRDYVKQITGQKAAS